MKDSFSGKFSDEQLLGLIFAMKKNSLKSTTKKGGYLQKKDGADAERFT